MADEIHTIRELCLEYLEDHFKAQQQGVPATDPYSITWSVVDRAEIDDLSHGKDYTIAIIDTTEQVDFGVSTIDGVTNKTLRVVFEWRAFINASARPSIEANRIIGEIIRRVMEDETLGGLAIWMQETGNDWFADNQNTRQIEGNVFMNLFYRHSRRDPRKDVC